jgi:hypothetical protein
MGFLFTEEELGVWLGRRLGEASQAITTWEPEALLSATDAHVIAHVVRGLRVTCPVLHRDRVEQLPVSDKPSVVHNASTRVVVAVPFEGDHEVFKLRPSTRPPRAHWAEIHEHELHLVWEGNSTSPESLHRHFEAKLSLVGEGLASAQEVIARYNDSLHDHVADLVARRRAHLQAARTGFPIRRRRDAEEHVVPMKRRPIAPQRPSAPDANGAEPYLASAQYEDALRVLMNMRNALERSPSTTEHLTENGIRDLLLVSLNARFEGRAAGEVFNGEGKTDILIRENDRNVFIAECKVWRGRRTATEALDQLLGYLVWRDTKAALLMFIRDDDATTATRDALKQIKAHPNYKRPGKIANNERYDVVVHANGDPHREIHLAFLPFLIARRKRPATRGV